MASLGHNKLSERKSVGDIRYRILQLQFAEIDHFSVFYIILENLYNDMCEWYFLTIDPTWPSKRTAVSNTFYHVCIMSELSDTHSVLVKGLQYSAAMLR